MVRRLLAVARDSLMLTLLCVAVAAGCHAARSPELRVLGVHEELRQDIVFVQVTNPASHSMKLRRLQYTFAAEGTQVSAGDMPLAREVPAGAAVVVEIPLDAASEKPLTMSGKLTAELGQIVRTFSVSARFQPRPSS